MYKRIFYFALVFVVVGAITSIAKGATLPPGPLIITYDGDGPIFSELNVAPGAEYTKTLTVTNNGTVDHSFAIATTNVTGELADHIYIEPELYGIQLWSLTVDQLSKIPTESQTILPVINPADSVTINLKARFDQSETSELADKTVSFDFIFGTQEAEPGTATTIAGLTAGITGAAVTGAGVIPATTPTITATATASPSGEGEVLGAEDNEGKQGLNGLLLLIPAGVLFLSVPFVTPGTRNAILPTLGAGTSVVLSFFTKGSMTPKIFWAILIAEIVLILVLDYLIVRKTVIEVLEEEEVLEKKARRAHTRKRR